MEEARVAVLSIIVEDPESVEMINSLLHDNSDIIIGRFGLPYRQRKISIICIVVDAPQNRISTLSGKIGRLSGVTCKATYSTK